MKNKSLSARHVQLRSVKISLLTLTIHHPMANFIIHQKLHLHFSTLGPWLQSPSLTHCPPEGPSGLSGLATAEGMREKKILLQMTKEQRPYLR